MAAQTSLHQRIYDARVAAEITQVEFAKAVGVKQQTVSRWETGVVIPDATKLADIARVLDLPMDELVSLRYQSELDRRNTDPSPAAVALSQRTESRVAYMEKTVKRLAKLLDDDQLTVKQQAARMDRIERALDQLTANLGVGRRPLRAKGKRQDERQGTQPAPRRGRQ